MKIKRRVMYTSLLVLGCVLLAWPNTAGHDCDGKFDSTSLTIQKEEREKQAALMEDMHPFLNLLPSCNLVFH